VADFLKNGLAARWKSDLASVPNVIHFCMILSKVCDIVKSCHFTVLYSLFFM
jgi:hypothetical protein